MGISRFVVENTIIYHQLNISEEICSRFVIIEHLHSVFDGGKINWILDDIVVKGNFRGYWFLEGNGL